MAITTSDFSGSVDGSFERTKYQRIQVNNSRLYKDYLDACLYFSVTIRDKGITVLEVSKGGNFLDGNMDRAEYDKDNVILRATQKGKPDYVPYEINGTGYKAVKVDTCICMPDKESVI